MKSRMPVFGVSKHIATPAMVCAVLWRDLQRRVDQVAIEGQLSVEPALVIPSLRVPSDPSVVHFATRRGTATPAV